MKRYPYFTIFVLMLLLACVSAPGLGAPPTSTPTSTNTSEPTFTALPTDTPTPISSATPNAAATAEARATQSAGDVLDELDKLLGDSDIPYKNGRLAWGQTKPLTLNLSGPDRQASLVDAKLTASNFILKSDVTWSATGIIFCGAIFRSEPDIGKGKQYQFLYLRLSGLPAWAIQVNEFGRFKNTITDTKFSDALDLGNGATNSFVLVAQDEKFSVYINSVRQGRFFDNSNQRTEGLIAFQAFQDSGKGSCEFKNSWVWILE